MNQKGTPLFSCQSNEDDFSRSNIGILDEFSWACHDAQLKEFMTSLLASSFKLIDCAFNTEEFEKWESGEQTEFSEYYLVASPTEKFEKYPAEELFESFIDQFEEQLKTLNSSNEKRLSEHLENISTEISDLSGKPLLISNNGFTPLGIHINDNNAFSYGVLTNTTYADVDGEIDLMQVSFISAVLGNKGILFKYYYRNFTNQTDIDIAKEKAFNWVSINR